jgi:hypothetical protein
MPYRLSAFLLAVALATFASARPAAASSKADRADADKASLAARVRDGVRQLGTGPDARVSVRRQHGKKVEGYVAAADDAAFIVVSQSGDATQIPYSDVSQVKGQNLATGWKIAIGAAIGAGVVLLVLFLYIASHE